MNWHFFKTKEKKVDEDQVQNMRKEVTALDEKVETTNEQIKKLMRLQFKMVKSMDNGFQDMKTDLQAQDEQLALQRHVEKLETSQQKFIQHSIQLLDEMDHIASGLTDERQTWHQLLEQWSRTIVETLDDAGVHELNVMGKGQLLFK